MQSEREKPAVSGRRKLSVCSRAVVSELHPRTASGSDSEGPTQEERAGMRRQLRLSSSAGWWPPPPTSGLFAEPRVSFTKDIFTPNAVAVKKTRKIKTALP